MKRLLFLIIAAIICIGATAQFKASVQIDNAMATPAQISAIYFILYYENDSTAQYDFATNDTAKTGIYDTILTLPADSIGEWRGDWYVSLADGKLLHFSQFVNTYEQDSLCNAMANKDEFKSSGDTALGGDARDVAITAMRDSLQYLITAAGFSTLTAAQLVAAFFGQTVDTAFAAGSFGDSLKGWGATAASALDSSLIDQIIVSALGDMRQMMGIDSGMTVFYEWHSDADTAWFVNSGGDTVRIAIYDHDGGTAGQRPDSVKETP